MIKKISFVGISMVLMALPLFASAAALNRQLEFGMSGSDVTSVQSFLATDPALYPQGLVTGYFGPLTKNAVANFQSRNGISPVGRIGPITLPVLNYQIANGMYAMSGGTNTSPGTMGDRVAPMFLSVNISNLNRNGALVSWNTDQTASGIVYYSRNPLVLTEQPNTVTVSGADFVSAGLNLSNTQNVSLTGLTPNTTYYYMISSVDQSGNQSVTWPSTFQTSP